jgi:N utilization substance protein B
MSARGKARLLALDFLYEGDLRGKSPLELLQERGTGEISQGEYVSTLLTGVSAHLGKIDEIITTYAQGWDLDRMPPIDRNILRIAIYEILWESQLDDQVAVSQAIEIAQELSTDDSSKYVNGVLGRIIALKSTFAI